MKPIQYDLIGIGIGPFNLGLAALAEETDEVNGIFFDETPDMDWHPGMLIEGTDLQVAFIADLVTFANPRSEYTFLNYLHTKRRLYTFFFFQKMEIPRAEYNEYVQWVASKLSNLHFGKRVMDVREKEQEGETYFEVVVYDSATEEETVYHSRHVVIGTGSKPVLFDSTSELSENDVIHSSQYVYKREEILKGKRITVIGSGQSASEIFADLLHRQQESGYQLNWFTRSVGIFQLDTSKLPQEFFSPDYIDYFNALTYEERKEVLPHLDTLQNGVDQSTLNDIYDTLYQRSVKERDLPITIQPATELKDVVQHGDGSYELTCHQWQTNETFKIVTDKVIMATGYAPNIPQWLIDRFGSDLIFEDEEQRLFKVGRDCEIKRQSPASNKLFTTTNISHAHGTGANNLGLAVNRNVKIINTVAKKEVYLEGHDTIFQQFRMENK
ncbi:lysine/ornithine N-monooxygenase [Pontibacillus halophilus JSM 076056 = DSM 19796]|uniref:L-lysine N6-monooxygenase MbtG n=1 Tax=Pontibacillus halophilus JSM 076056 = DSM 19796 TaxID=1385510 RepID=A0A0A5ICS9_9BACI|nr:SidA/IucD/PvdA family monooxygenase [Pontibacillus halophilus]KGX93652.1 lysine/ornithine N-monooxygenase [Pontibacillus halophilus JSM 076056 = DSM 19796]